MNTDLFKKIGKLLVIGTLGSALLLGCGGGGGGGAASNNPAFIVAGVTLYAAPISSYVAVVIVETDSTNRIPITTATVTVNGVALALAQNNTIYTSNAVLPDGSGNFNLTVTANGTTYTATESAFTSPPVVTVPAFTASAVNTITWTAPGGAPAPGNGMFYDLLIQHQSTHTSAYALELITALSADIPAGTTQTGLGYIATVSGIHIGSQIVGAVTGSNLSMSALSQQASYSAR
jgi:hypothetical protein